MLCETLVDAWEHKNYYSFKNKKLYQRVQCIITSKNLICLAFSSLIVNSSLGCIGIVNTFVLIFSMLIIRVVYNTYLL